MWGHASARGLQLNGNTAVFIPSVALFCYGCSEKVALQCNCGREKGMHNFPKPHLYNLATDWMKRAVDCSISWTNNSFQTVNTKVLFALHCWLLNVASGIEYSWWHFGPSAFTGPVDRHCTGNVEKLSNIWFDCLTWLCLAAAKFLSFSCVSSCLRAR